MAGWRATFAVAQKELRSSFRDRQTVLYAVVVPIAMYPLLLWVLIQGALLVQGRDELTTVGLGVVAGVEGLPEGLHAALEEPEARHGLASRELNRVWVETLPPGSDGEPAPSTREAARAWLEEPDGPAAVLWIPGADEAAGGTRAQLYHDATRRDSRIARDRALERVEPFALDLRIGAVTARGESPEALIPFELAVTNVAVERDMLAYILAFLLPMLLVGMCVMGAFFPAVDLTAGEKERSTAETTLLLPIPRLAVHQGKILAVCCSAMLATALNLTALGLSVGHLVDMLTGGSVALGSLPILALLAISPLAALFSFFISAVLTSLASLARSFEDGQALLGPVQIFFIAPALVGIIPGIDLTLPLCLVPVVNVSLAFRGLLLGEVMPGEYALVATSLLLCAVLSMRVAVAVLERDGHWLRRGRDRTDQDGPAASLATRALQLTRTLTQGGRRAA